MKYTLTTYFFLFLFVFNIQLIGQSSSNYSAWSQILILNVTNNGKVNYKGIMIHSSSLFYEYFRSLSQNPPRSNWSKEKKIAYWVNVYNSIAMKMVIDNYPIKSIRDIENPWKHKFFKIKDKKYSLDDIEHDILRKMNEPRIHFVINCAANSSPKLWNMAYSEKNIMSSLEEKTYEFINDPTKNLITPNTVKISEVFKWYKGDFNNGDVVSYINQYSKIKINAIPENGYMQYDWRLNETH